MSREHVELGAAAMIVVVVLIAVGLIAWSILSNDEEPEIPSHSTSLQTLKPSDAWAYEQLTGIRPEDVIARHDASVVASHCAQAFSWPQGGEYLSAARSVEPVRETFRRMLEGGPDYRG